MLQQLKELYEYEIQAIDGYIGKVHDFLFDGDWIVRYIVMDTGDWLSGRRVLISPVVLNPPGGQKFVSILTKGHIENSPDIDTDKPISRQREIELHQYYGWPIYWMALDPAAMPGEVLKAAKEAAKKALTKSDSNDSHLQSTQQVIGYHIHASDGEIGSVEDFIVDADAWKLRYMVVETQKAPPGRKVLIAPDWIETINWSAAKINLNFSREQIKNSPTFDASAPVNREYEKLLYDYYGQPKYWV